MVVNHFKGAVTRYARHYADPTFAWQSRFHERFVRTEKEMNALRQYIVMNPKRRYFDHLDRIRRDMPPGMSEMTTP